MLSEFAPISAHDIAVGLRCLRMCKIDVITNNYVIICFITYHMVIKTYWDFQVKEKPAFYQVT
jgi:hypothetical protein